MQNYAEMWFGFSGQPHGKSFGDGRFRLAGENIGLTSLERNVADVTEIACGLRRVIQIPPAEEVQEIDHADRMRKHLISQFQWEVFV